MPSVTQILFRSDDCALPAVLGSDVDVWCVSRQPSTKNVAPSLGCAIKRVVIDAWVRLLDLSVR